MSRMAARLARLGSAGPGAAPSGPAPAAAPLPDPAPLAEPASLPEPAPLAERAPSPSAELDPVFAMPAILAGRVEPEPEAVPPPSPRRTFEEVSLFGAAPRPAPVPPAPRATAAPVNGTLDELRARMDAILARNRAPSPPPRVDDGDLPFCVEDTPAGPLHVRTLRHGGEHRIGRIPVAPARRASAELLALLALDPALATCDPAGALYLDTETTGLGPGAGTVAFLVGLAWFDAGTAERPPALVVEQLLVRRLGEEGPVLARVAERIQGASMLVTFNGKSFDLPVLRTRFVMGRLAAPKEPPHLDLVHVARRLHKGRGVGARLGTVERAVLGFERVDDVPSGEVSACYLHFLRGGDPRALMGVVEHNAWDVVSMAALVGLYGEPLAGSQLEAGDLVGMARTLQRAGDKALAEATVEEALARGAGLEGTRARAEIAKARGDKARALVDFETLAASVDDPVVRLELAKLYEHHAKDAARALALVAAGTGESDEQRVRREARLRQKLERASVPKRRRAKPPPPMGSLF